MNPPLCHPKNLAVFPETDDLGHLHLESTLKELSLHNYKIDSHQPGQEVYHAFRTNPILPGVILQERGRFLGMISRRRFLEYMSRPYGLELFLKRPIGVLYQLAKASTNFLIFSGDALIVDAARQALRRSPDWLYEPILVQLTELDYRIVDVHQLLVAQSNIHELTTHLLRENTQAHLIQTEKLASLGQMIAGVAHEIRNPTNTIHGNIKFLSNYSEELIKLLALYEREYPEISEAIAQYKEEIDFAYLQEDLPQLIQSVLASSERLNALVSSLRNFSHMSESHPHSANLHECLDSTLLILHNRLKQGIEVIKNYGELPLMSCYSGQLSQVFMNLLSNAIDAVLEKQATAVSDWKPTITITTQVLTDCPSAIAQICISDNGIGMSPEVQKRIFETFFTTKPVGQGTGLGLAISQQIIHQKHQGELKVRSQLGSGTEFEILLPIR